MEKKTGDPDSVCQWLLQSWVSVCFSQRLSLKARTHHWSIAYKMLVAGSMSCAQQPLTRDSAICNSKEAKLATIHPMEFCPYCLGSVLVYMCKRTSISVLHLCLWFCLCLYKYLRFMVLPSYFLIAVHICTFTHMHVHLCIHIYVTRMISFHLCTCVFMDLCCYTLVFVFMFIFLFTWTFTYSKFCCDVYVPVWSYSYFCYSCLYLCLCFY